MYVIEMAKKNVLKMLLMTRDVNPLPARKIFALTMSSARFFWAHGQFHPLRV